MKNIQILILLIIVSSIGFVGCDNQIEAVNPGPVPESGFIYQLQTGSPGRVSFASTSTGHNQLAWDFGNGSFAYNQDAVTRNYTKSGTYSVRLTAINVAGTSTFEDSVTVVVPPALTANFNVSFDSNQPLTVFIEDNSENAESYQWNFGDGNSSTSENISSYTYENSGTYSITLRTTRGEEQTPTFRVSFTIVNPEDLHNNSTKTWKFKDSPDSPGYFVERNGELAFSYTLLSCELNDRYIFTSDRTFLNDNKGDTRIIQEGGECRTVEVPSVTNYNFVRLSNSDVSFSLPGSYIVDLNSGPLYRIRSVSSDELVIAFDRINPFNTAQAETVVMILEPEL